MMPIWSLSLLHHSTISSCEGRRLAAQANINTAVQRQQAIEEEVGRLGQTNVFRRQIMTPD